MSNFDFDIYINNNAEDKYMVENISQFFRDNGYTTFDRSVDSWPNSETENISEVEALRRSLVMLYVLTENSVNDPSDQDMVARAISGNKPIIVMSFDGAEVPAVLTESKATVVEADRYDLLPSLRKICKLI